MNIIVSFKDQFDVSLDYAADASEIDITTLFADASHHQDYCDVPLLSKSRPTIGIFAAVQAEYVRLLAFCLSIHSCSRYY